MNTSVPLLAYLNAYTVRGGHLLHAEIYVLSYSNTKQVLYALAVGVVHIMAPKD